MCKFDVLVELAVGDSQWQKYFYAKMYFSVIKFVNQIITSLIAVVKTVIMIDFLRSIFNSFIGIWNSIPDDAKAEIRKAFLRLLEEFLRGFYKKYTGNN